MRPRRGRSKAPCHDKGHPDQHRQPAGHEQRNRERGICDHRQVAEQLARRRGAGCGGGQADMRLLDRLVEAAGVVEDLQAVANGRNSSG